MACRAEILQAFVRLSDRTGRDAFSPQEIITGLRQHGSRYRDSTIRTHVVSRMCSNAPDHHAVVYDDLERVQQGLYRLRRSST
jgi:hypothetical protein